MPLYISRAEAVAAYAGDDPEADEQHVFQGDIYHSLELFSPATHEKPLTSAIVVSHHCEWTKAKARFAQEGDWPLLVAPVHELDAFEPHERKLIRENKFRHFLHLPEERPTLDRELAADLRLIQPFPASYLERHPEYYWTSVSPELNRHLKAKVIEYLYRDFTLS